MADYLPDITTGNKDYMAAMQQLSDPSSSAPNKQLGQADFLMLLTTQMQNQDPSKPMDPTSFVTDLTQMSQLESTNKMTESIMALTTGFQNMQTLQGASLIGKSVQVNGEEFSHTQGQDSQLTLNADQPLTDVKLVVSDSNGLVKEIDVGALQEGEKIVSWDGLDNVGVERGSGVYSLTAYGTDENGDLKSIDTVVASKVNSVGVNTDGSITLTLATGEKVAMDAVREISA
ncbi:flagellar hook capping FlgD N-terminal domain-containing protein [Thiomicrorhabdus sp. ZW0627]|uniref:flagellar hook assembly protein FlgD n=1 Tax=Thiomicrorhabdus sp. ZW0627 TaxID=3039774 RepID=UPI00243721A1|nr:flagellar hook capping FlgD N-terminal domain-containing protein [Thiomicrorhabdus sp. ZW0627]MDG6773376.1 flagellar hook capping FlgD N-terminal domain-containing protein [Thiomicrorhabdus sp. ZW0627]